MNPIKNCVPARPGQLKPVHLMAFFLLCSVSTYKWKALFGFEPFLLNSKYKIIPLELITNNHICKKVVFYSPLVHIFLPKTSPSESTISSSSPVSLTTFLTYLSALEVMVLHTGGKICEIHEDIVFGTFLTKTVKANRNKKGN